MTKSAAIVLGASGSVGNAVVDELIRSHAFHPIFTIVRRTQTAQVARARDEGVELRESIVVDMTPATVEATTTALLQSIDSPGSAGERSTPGQGVRSWIDSPGSAGERSTPGQGVRSWIDSPGSAGERSTPGQGVRSIGGTAVGLSVLGIGAGTAKLSIDDHRAVDVQLNAAFARGLQRSGKVKHLALMSAVGANPHASTSGSGAAGMARYARVKGEAEEAVKASGLAVVSTFRPAMIIGSQHTPWLLEKVLPVFSFVTPAKYRSISVEQIAAAMVATSVNPPEQSAVYHYSDMVRLGQSAHAQSHGN